MANLPVEERVRRIERYVDSKRLIRYTTKFYLHRPSSSGKRCPCCDSTKAELYEVRDDLDLLVNPVGNAKQRNRRFYHEAKDKKKWLRLAKDAKHVKIPLRCTEKGMEFILSDIPISFASGAARSTKSMHGLYKFAREWLKRGGPNAKFLLMGPTVDLTHVLMGKLIRGEQVDGRFSPPVIPSSCVISYPKNKLNKVIEMNDGSKFHLQHAKAKDTEKAIKAISAQYVIMTEASEVPDPAIYSQLHNRLVDADGGMVIDSTFREEDSWLVTDCYHFCREEEERFEREMYEYKQGKSKKPPRRQLAKHTHFTPMDNPWLSDEQIEEWQIKIKRNPIAYKREFLGQPASDKGLLWKEVFNDTTRPSILFDMAGFDMSEVQGDVYGKMGSYPDITKRATRRIKGFSRHSFDYLIGMDANKRPWSGVMATVVGDPDDPKTWILCILDVLQVWDSDAELAKGKLKKIHKGIFCNQGIVIDANCFSPEHSKAMGHTKFDSSAVVFQQAGFTMDAPDRTKNRKFMNPPRYGSIALTKRLFREGRIRINHQRCKSLVTALENQTENPKEAGTHFVETGKRSEVYAGLTDSLRYLVWALFASEEMKIKKGPTKPINLRELSKTSD